MNSVLKRIVSHVLILCLIGESQAVIADGFGDIFKVGADALQESLTGKNKTNAGTEKTEVNPTAMGLGCAATLVIGLLGKDALSKLADKLAKGNKQKKNQYLLGMALAGCAVGGQLTSSIYTKISDDAKRKINEDMIKAANTGESISGSDPQHANISWKIDSPEKPYKEFIAGKEHECKPQRVILDDSEATEGETALTKFCRELPNGKFVQA